MTDLHILSPLPGTFFRRSAPDQPEYVKEGTKISEGDVIGLVEVMKSFHEVKADKNGTVKAILVENGDAVSAGQPLIEIN